MTAFFHRLSLSVLGFSALVATTRAAQAQSEPLPSNGAVIPPELRPAQDDDVDAPPTLIGRPRDTNLGGYLSLGGAYTRMLGRDGGVVSLEAALLFRHRLSLGLAAYGFSETPAGPPDTDGTPRRFGTGYGGLAARYSFFSDLPVYATVGFVIGGGAVALDEHIGNDRDRDRAKDPEAHGYFVFQPEVSVQANVTRWLRVGIDGGYRLTSNVDQFHLDGSDLNGVLVGGHVQVGWL